MDQRPYEGDLGPPRARGTKRPAQNSPSRGRQLHMYSAGRQVARPHGAVSGYARASYSLSQPMAPPQQRYRQFAKQPVRQNFHNSSPISARRMAPSTMAISAPIPVKSAQHRPPQWQVNDATSARENTRFAAMSIVGSRAATRSDYRSITDNQISYTNDQVRKEYGSTLLARLRGKDPPSDNGSSSSSESSEDEDAWESMSESERESERDKPDSEDDLSDDDVQIVDNVPSRPLVIEILDDTPPPSPPPTPQPSRPTEEIIGAIEDLTLSLTCLQDLHRLPFLKRNLRRGFQIYCAARGVPIETENNCQSIAVVFKIEEATHEASISCYECPLCQIHFPFQTKEMLETHLDLDHSENTILPFIIIHPFHRLPRQESLAPVLELFPPDDLETPPNPLGPTARFPFLPAKSEYGGPDVKYSVRFGGPKVYDLLGTLPMKEYGVLAWAVLDKEEEIFESDDIPDHHKVMHALWGRWIFSNRNIFIAHYLNAGYDALRYWLMVMMTTGYLTPKDIALVLKYYTDWCI
ncbi:hypothetical protein C8R46DRAFT_1054518 [Mycena filopes]|nr:hypothetical protein C8R46DRAFT_1054518 [Mycena filopes]